MEETQFRGIEFYVVTQFILYPSIVFREKHSLSSLSPLEVDINLNIIESTGKASSYGDIYPYLLIHNYQDTPIPIFINLDRPIPPPIERKRNAGESVIGL